MTSIDAINKNKFNPHHLTPEQQQQKKDNAQKAATVVGSTGFAASATKYASRRGLRAQAGEKTLQTMMEATQKAAKITGKGIKESTGFIASFKRNFKMYTADLLKWANKFQNNKILGPIIKSPVMKKLAGAFGGVMAFFVLITGVTKAAESGALAVDDFRGKYHQMRNAS